jgi:beta-lactam-binding protein with PASTA domain
MMSKLVGQSINVAQNVLAAAGLVAQIESGSPRLGGKVLEQRPPYGTKIRKGSVVYLSVGSSG